MPRKIINRLIPNMTSAVKRPSMGWLKKLISDPNLLHINRHSVSLAVYIGIVSAFVPLPGQTIIALLMCFWFGANLPIAAVVIWVSNPITIPPMFYLTYRLGSLLLGTQPIDFTLSLTWQWLLDVGTQIILPLMVGSLLCGILFATIGYFFVLQLWRWKVVQSWERRNAERIDLARKAAAQND